MKHYSVTVIVTEVTDPEPLREASGYAVKVGSGPHQTVVMTDRRVKEIFKATVSASDEASAYGKSIALLEVNRPEPVTAAPGRPIRDNPQA